MAKVKGRLPSKGPNSPFSAGSRTLIARTCLECGELADGDSFPLLNRGTKNEARRKVCHHCTNAQKKRLREERGIGLPPSQRPPVPMQTAKRRWWSAEEDKFLRESIGTESYEDMAYALGRSLNAVYTRRGILGLSTVRKKHRVEKPWKIQ